MEKARATEILLQRQRARKVELFGWNGKQSQIFAAKERFVCICGANQYSGKTTANTARAAIQYTAQYPSWWTGRRWEGDIKVACCSKTLDKLRDTVLDKIFGTKEQLGTGWIPKELIIEDSIIWSKKAKNCIEYCEIKRVDEDYNVIGITQFYAFSFEQGWERVSGYTLQDVLISEECDLKFYDEMRARGNSCNGQIVIDMIPLDGATPLWKSFDQDETGTRKHIEITIDDCTQYTEEEREQAKLEYADDPWVQTRLYGRPTMGEGAIFRVPERNLTAARRVSDWPLNYKAIIGIDIPHSTGCFAAVKMFYDEKKDRLHVMECIKLWDVSRDTQAQRLLDMGAGSIPVAWPHDAGRNEGDKSDAAPISEKFRKAGCNMLSEPAYLIGLGGKKSNKTMDWINDVRDREKTGLIEYYDVEELLAERRMYAQKDGKIIRNQDDHCLDAMGKGVFMLRHAKPLGHITLHPYKGRAMHAPKKLVTRREVDFFSI